MASEILDTVLLMALPASGKSEVRRYMDHVDPEVCRRDFRMGPTVQLDDFPYVHFLLCVDDVLEELGKPRLSYPSRIKPMLDLRDWGTLSHMVAEDYHDLCNLRKTETEDPVGLLFDRLDKAAALSGAPIRFATLDAETRATVAERVREEAQGVIDGKNAAIPDSLEGKTIIIEFARGGPDGARMPLQPPVGYRYSLSQLSEELLSRATILYIWVTPEESRRKNFARADPDDPGSILHHGVPIDVMLGDYGCDDIDWLVDNAVVPGTIRVEAHGKTFDIPIARFDNRVDKTSFLRDDPADWPADQVEALHQELANGLGALR